MEIQNIIIFVKRKIRKFSSLIQDRTAVAPHRTTRIDTTVGRPTSRIPRQIVQLCQP